MLKKLNMILLLVYILFYIAVTSNFIHHSSLLKFFVHILFGTVGFINGLYYQCSNKK